MHNMNAWRSFKKTSKANSKLDNIKIRYLYHPLGCEYPEDFKQLLISLQDKFGGTRSTPLVAAGSDGLIEFSFVLKLNLTIIIAPFIAKFLDGLLNGDELKRVGEDYRRRALKWFSQTEKEVAELIRETENLLIAYPNALVCKGLGTKIPIIIEVDEDLSKIKIFVEFDAELPEEAIRSLSLSISNAVSFIVGNKAMAGIEKLEMKFDYFSNEWFLQSITAIEIPKIHSSLSNS